MLCARKGLLLTHSINLDVDIAPEPLLEIWEHDIDEAHAVIHVINLDDFEDTKNKQPSTSASFNNKLLIMLILSLVLHALTFYLLNLRIKLPSLLEKKEQPLIIQAKLYTPPKTEVINEPEPESRVEPEPIEVPEVQEPEIQETNEDTVPIEESVVIEEPITVEPEPLDEPPPQPEVPVEQQQTEPEVNRPITRPRSLFDTRAVTDLRALNEAKQNSLADDAFREYQYNRVHPEINTNPKQALQFTAEENRQLADQQLYNSRAKIKTDCKKVAGKALSILGYLAGGAVECLKNPEFKSFIQKRLEETNSAPPSK